MDLFYQCKGSVPSFRFLIFESMLGNMGLVFISNKRYLLKSVGSYVFWFYSKWFLNSALFYDNGMN